MLRDTLAGLIEPMLRGAGVHCSRAGFSPCCSRHRTIDPQCLENPRPAGAESTLTENARSPFHAEPRHLDYAGPDSHSRLTRLPCCLPPTRQGVGILIWRFSKLNHPAHQCLGLRFATHLAMCHARLEVRMESLSPFLWGSCIPCNMPVVPKTLTG